MEDTIITFETAKLAKNKGFNIKICNCGGFPECICINDKPTQSLLQKYLREVHNILVYCLPSVNINEMPVENEILKRWFWEITTITDRTVDFDLDAIYDYEIALELGLQYALTLIKNKI